MIRIFSFFILLSCTSAFASDLLSPEEFSKEYAQLVLKNHPGSNTEHLDELAISVTSAEGEQHTAYLDNAYLQYKGSPDSLNSILEDHINALASTGKFDDKIKNVENIVPVIKDNLYLSSLIEAFTRSPSASAKSPKIPYHEQLNSELVVLYAFDSPSALRFVSKEDIEELGIDMGELRKIAIKNLLGRLPSMSREGDNSLSMLSAGGHFEASLLLVEDIWNSSNFPVNGKIVVFVPSRDVVLITGSEDQQGLDQAREIVEKNNWPYMISSYPYVWQNKKWIRYAP